MNSKDMINKAKEQAKIIFTPRLLKNFVLSRLSVLAWPVAVHGIIINRRKYVMHRFYQQEPL